MEQDINGAVEAPPEWKRIPKVALSDLMVAPGQARPQGVELTASGWAFVGVGSASAATVAVATAVALRGAAAVTGAPGVASAGAGEGTASLLGPASSGVVASAPLAAPTAAAPSAAVSRVSVPPLLLPAAVPAATFAPGAAYVAPAPTAFGGAQAAGFLSAPQQQFGSATVSGETGSVGVLAAAVSAAPAGPGFRTEISKGSLPALPALGSRMVPAAAPRTADDRIADDMASALAFSAALGAADSAGTPAASPVAIRSVGGGRALEAKPRLLAAARLIRPEAAPRSLGAAPVAPAPVRLAVLPTVSAARPVAGGPDLVVTGMVLSEDGQGQDVAVVRSRTAPEGSRGRFVTVGDAVGEGNRYVVSAIRAGGVEVRDTLALVGKQQPSFRLSAYNATQGMRRSAEEQTAPLPHFGRTPAAIQQATSAPVLAAAPVAQAALAGEAPKAAEAAEAAAPVQHATAPKFELHTGAEGAGTVEAPLTVAGRHPEFTWKFTSGSGAALTTLAGSNRSSEDKPAEKSEQVIDFRVLVFSADDDAPSGGAPKSEEGRVVAASTPLFDARWMADEPLAPGKAYRWQVFARMADGTLHVSSSGYFRVAMP